MLPKSPQRKSKTDIGRSGEKYAAELLRKKGYKILEKNFRTKIGEIDIVAKDKDVLVFVEVKVRRNKKHGKPEEAVTPRKISKIRRVVDWYHTMNNTWKVKQRIDVVAIEVEDGEVTSAKIIKVD